LRTLDDVGDAESVGRTPPVGGLACPGEGRTSPVGGLKWTAPAKGSEEGTEPVGRFAGLPVDGGAPMETRAVNGLIDPVGGLVKSPGGTEPVGDLPVPVTAGSGAVDGRVEPVAGRGVVGGI
jgi:hypothetical protein